MVIQPVGPDRRQNANRYCHQGSKAKGGERQFQCRPEMLAHQEHSGLFMTQRFAETLIGSRALAVYGDVDGPPAANNRPWSRKCTAKQLRRSDARASARGCEGTRSVRRGGAGSVG